MIEEKTTATLNTSRLNLSQSTKKKTIRM